MNKMDLSKVSRIVLPQEVAVRTQAFLGEVGSKGLEGVVLWAGVLAGDTFTVTDLIIPEQQAFGDEEGLCYVVDGAALHRINVWLFGNRKTLVAQVHSHPSEAYHSITDDRYPMVTAVGSLSIVVPDFAEGPFDLRKCVAYRLTSQGIWKGLSASELLSLIDVDS